MEAPQMTDAYEWQGRNLVGSDGDKIGRIEEIYLDRATDRPEWALVNTGLFGTKSNFVPLAGASPSGGDVKVGVTKDEVKDAPGIDPDGELSPEEESTLYSHYGFDYGDYDDSTGEDEGVVGRDVSGPETDEAMTRSEEELAVGTRTQESGRVRLRKYVVTENVTQTVPVRREEVRVEREPITDANVDAATDGPAISEEEHEVVLHEEEVVTEKRAVPKERIRLDKDTVVDEQQVSEEVSKEQVEVEGDR
jgi:uncharacterized protein (TIGR02271 family)